MKVMDEKVKHGKQEMAEEGNIVCSGKYPMFDN